MNFVSNKIPLKTPHLGVNQAPYMTKELSKAIMLRSRLTNTYLKTKAQEDKKI